MFRIESNSHAGFRGPTGFCHFPPHTVHYGRSRLLSAPETHMLIRVSAPGYVCPLLPWNSLSCHSVQISPFQTNFPEKKLYLNNLPSPTKRNKETFGHDGYVHYVNYGYEFMDVHTSNLSKRPTLNTCYLFHSITLQ